MTTKADIIILAKSIAERFKSNVVAPLYMKEYSSYPDEAAFYFNPEPDSNHWNSYCNVTVAFDYCTREQSDEVGFFTTQDVKISFRSQNPGGVSYSIIQPKLNAFNKAVELMGLLVAELPQTIVERTATHEERAEENKILAATNYCRSIVSNNSKNMRVEGAKCLPAAPEAIRRGEYTITHNGKKFNLALTDQHTLLVRVS